MGQRSPDRTIAALRTLHDHVVERVRGLDAAALGTPSGATEWSVADVLGHLGSGAEIHVATIQATLDGVAPPPFEANQPIWDRWDAMDDAERRDGFLEWGERLIALHEAMSPTQRQEVRFDIAFLPEPADVVVAGGLRANELTLHGWDVDVAFDPSAALPSGGLDLLVDSMAPLLPFAGHADRLADGPVTLRVELTHPTDVLGLDLGPEVVSLDREVPAVGGSDAVLHAPTEAFVRLVAGRLRPEHTPGSVQVEGAVTLDELRAVFPGY